MTTKSILSITGKTNKELMADEAKAVVPVLVSSTATQTAVYSRMKTFTIDPNLFKTTSTLTGINSTPIMWFDDPKPSEPPGPEQWAIWLAEAKGLIDKGYRRISRRRGVLSRIDREDWHQVLCSKYPRPKWLHDADALDFYRRILSQDKVTVRRYVSELIPCSSGDTTGYVS